MKFNVICADPPWKFNDKLTMSDVKRGSDSHYKTLDIETLKKLSLQDISEKDSLLCLWTPSSLLLEGLQLMMSWDFIPKQTFIWVKTKNDPLKELSNLDDVLSFNMGSIFRNTHEFCLIGTKGKINNILKNRSQRTVCFDKCFKHSTKTEKLQDKLDIMFPDSLKLELFARRNRNGWVCVGNELGNKEDIFDSINILKDLNI